MKLCGVRFNGGPRRQASLQRSPREESSPPPPLPSRRISCRAPDSPGLGCYPLFCRSLLGICAREAKSEEGPCKGAFGIHKGRGRNHKLSAEMTFQNVNIYCLVKTMSLFDGFFPGEEFLTLLEHIFSRAIGNCFVQIAAICVQLKSKWVPFGTPRLWIVAAFTNTVSRCTGRFNILPFFLVH